MISSTNRYKIFNFYIRTRVCVYIFIDKTGNKTSE